MSARWPRCHNGGKTCYPSRAKARKYARFGHDHYPNVYLYEYVCPACGAWHITKQPPSKPNERTA